MIEEVQAQDGSFPLQSHHGNVASPILQEEAGFWIPVGGQQELVLEPQAPPLSRSDGEKDRVNAVSSHEVMQHCSRVDREDQREK